MLVNDNTAEYNISQEKKETIHNAAVGMTSRFVGFLKVKTSQESREWVITLRQSHRLVISSPLSPSQKECETNPRRE